MRPFQVFVDSVGIFVFSTAFHSHAIIQIQTPFEGREKAKEEKIGLPGVGGCSPFCYYRGHPDSDLSGRGIYHPHGIYGREFAGQ